MTDARILFPVEDGRLLLRCFSVLTSSLASAAFFSSDSRCFTIRSKADSLSISVSYFPLIREDELIVERCSVVMAPI